MFLEDGYRCSIYNARPTQCRTYPFWPRFVQSPEGTAPAIKLTAELIL